MRIMSVVGARPQFIKAAPVCRALRSSGCDEVLVHSGQHFDHAMSQVFFDELQIPAPDHNLGVAGGSHGAMTGQMLEAIEKLLQKETPEMVLVYGDTNTTLAAGLAAAKLQIPVAHIEAGLRSFNRAMPEELNRVLTDHLSDVLFCPTDTAVENLAAEGITAGVHQVGDVMLDAARYYADAIDAEAAAARYGLAPGAYFLATVHRASTADDPQALASIIDAFSTLDQPVLWPVHPRTRKVMESSGLLSQLQHRDRVKLVEPLSYLETNALLRGAAALLTDSGGMQKEAYFFRVPCITLREETEWVETVHAGWNQLVGTSAEAIVAAASRLMVPAEHPSFYGDGHAAEKIATVLERSRRA